MLEKAANIVAAILNLGFVYEVFSYIFFHRPMLRFGITFDKFSIGNIDFEDVNRTDPKSFMKGKINEKKGEVYFRRKYLTIPGILLGYWYSPFMAVMKYHPEKRRFDVQLKIARMSTYLFVVLMTMCLVGILVLRSEASGVLAFYLLLGFAYWFLHYLSFRNIKDEVITLLEAQAQKGA